VRARIAELRQRMNALAEHKMDNATEKVVQEVAPIAVANSGDYFSSGLVLRRTQQNRSESLRREGRPLCPNNSPEQVPQGARRDAQNLDS
jgi:hypothetical protein